MSGDPKRSVASTRALELIVAALLLVAGAVVIWDSVRVGFRWVEDGPQAGYFPFYVGVLLCAASLWTLARALLDRRALQMSFVTAGALKSILSMLVPSIVYVALVAWLGLYVASFLYIVFFMIWLGKYSWGRSVVAAGSVSAVAFLLFDVWFKLPLPKGPIEAMLGLN